MVATSIGEACLSRQGVGTQREEAVVEKTATTFVESEQGLRA